jgi:hypothetical protein
MPRLVNLTAIAANFTHTTVEAEGFLGTTKMVLPLSLDEFKQGMAKWDGGEYIQNAFPTLSKVQREFLMTGMSAETQERVFAEPEDEDA